MIQLELTTEEAQHLKEEVKTRLTELDHEIAHRDEILRLKAFGQLSECARLVPTRRNRNTSARVDLQNA